MSGARFCCFSFFLLFMLAALSSGTRALSPWKKTCAQGVGCRGVSSHAMPSPSLHPFPTEASSPAAAGCSRSTDTFLARPAYCAEMHRLQSGVHATLSIFHPPRTNFPRLGHALVG